MNTSNMQPVHCTNYLQSQNNHCIILVLSTQFIPFVVTSDKYSVYLTQNDFPSSSIQTIANYKNIFWFYHFYSVLMYLSLEFQLRSTVINTSTELYKKVAGSKGK